MSDRPQRTSKAEIYRALRERICLLDIPPGSRLPEEAIAREFGVSRTPVRQVLDRLEYEGLLVQQPGWGATVSSVDMKSLRDVWAVRLRIAEILGDFVRLPAPPAVIERLHHIRQRVEGIYESRDTRELGRLYNEYHATVLDVVINGTLRRINDQLYHQTSRLWLQFLPEMDLDEEVRIFIEEIDETIEALASDSGRSFAQIRVKHMQLLLDRFNKRVMSY